MCGCGYELVEDLQGRLGRVGSSANSSGIGGIGGGPTLTLFKHIFNKDLTSLVR